MRDLIAFGGACLLATMLLLATGCTGQSCPSGCPCDGSCCPDCPCGPADPFANPDCPGGQCPYVPEPVGSIEVGDAATSEVNEAALRETKDGPGPCANCPSCVIQPSRVVLQPSSVVVQPSSVAQPSKVAASRPAVTVASDVRTGTFRCVRCNRGVVGDEWHEMWADDDTPMTCLCEQCWQSTTATEKRSHLTSYLERSALPASQQFYAEQLIGSIR